MTITKHSKQRIVERVNGTDNFLEAKKDAKNALIKGQTIADFYNYPRFFDYLIAKRSQTNSCSIRVYKGNIFIWRGRKKILVTVHPIPDRFKEEILSLDK